MHMRRVCVCTVCRHVRVRVCVAVWSVRVHVCSEGSPQLNTTFTFTPGRAARARRFYLSQAGKFKHLSFFPEWSGLVVYSLRGTRACRVASVDGRGGRAFAYRVIARGSLSLIR